VNYIQTLDGCRAGCCSCTLRLSSIDFVFWLCATAAAISEFLPSVDQDIGN